jgi:hypothetical protein
MVLPLGANALVFFAELFLLLIAQVILLIKKPLLSNAKPISHRNYEQSKIDKATVPSTIRIGETTMHSWGDL